MSFIANQTGNAEVDILARFLGAEDGRLPEEFARYILDRRISEQDQIRMHDLAVRNQDGKLSTTEQEELFAYARAGTLISTLKSRSRQTLGIKLDLPVKT